MARTRSDRSLCHGRRRHSRGDACRRNGRSRDRRHPPGPAVARLDVARGRRGGDARLAPRVGLERGLPTVVCRHCGDHPVDPAPRAAPPLHSARPPRALRSDLRRTGWDPTHDGHRLSRFFASRPPGQRPDIADPSACRRRGPCARRPRFGARCRTDPGDSHHGTARLRRAGRIRHSDRRSPARTPSAAEERSRWPRQWLPPCLSRSRHWPYGPTPRPRRQ